MKKILITGCLLLLITGIAISQPGPISPFILRFLDLIDTPSTMTGKDGYVVKVDETNGVLTFEAESGGVEDDAYGAGWNGDTTHAPSQNAVYDKFESLGGGGFDSTTIDTPTWSDGANASNVWTFDVSGTDTTMTFGNGIVTFSHAVTVTGTLTGTLTGNADTVTNGVYTTDNLSALAATTSAQLYGILSDETGSAAGVPLAVFNQAPTIDSPTFTTAITATDLITNAHFTHLTDWGDLSTNVTGNVLIDDDAVDNAAVDWADIDNLGDEGALVVADTADATSFPALFESATGTLAIKTDAGLTYNATTANLATTTFTGALSGNATTATTASVSTTVTITDNENTAENNPLVFVENGDLDGGNLGLESDGDAYYTPSTGIITATGFAGALTGNVTGDITGNAGTCTTASAGDAAVDFFGAGVDAVTDTTTCTDIEGTGLSIAAGTLNWSAASTDLTDTADLLYETELDELSELITQMADVTAFITDDDMPAVATDPDVDAAGEIGRDSDGANETGDSSLRGYDGANQFLYSRKLKTINFTLISPDTIDAADCIPIWHNTSGMTFTIVEWKAWSDDDNVSLEIEELTDQTDYTARTQVDAVEIATNGTGVYYASDGTITHAAIETDHSIAIDFDTADTPDYVQICIIGWFNADVD